MPHSFLRPYAALAIIEHEFDTDHLNIFVVFRSPMNQNLKPANVKWICKVDDVVKAVTDSAWQDEWTMLLTVDAIASIPDRVTIEYNGPDSDLVTTWNKQWEPWGPILSSDSTLLPYGSYKGNEFMWQQVAAQNTWYTISDVGLTTGPVHKTIFQNNQELKVSVSGFYTAEYYITLEMSIANKHVKTAFQINGTEQELGQMHHEFARAGEEESWSAPGIFNLTVDDVLSIGIMTPDAGNPTISVDHAGLVLFEIGKA